MNKKATNPGTSQGAGPLRPSNDRGVFGTTRDSCLVPRSQTEAMSPIIAREVVRELVEEINAVLEGNTTFRKA
jgi:hypothetical protein